VINFVHSHRAVQNDYNIRPEIAEVNLAQWALVFLCYPFEVEEDLVVTRHPVQGILLQK
jgi:hypothetical protein